MNEQVLQLAMSQGNVPLGSEQFCCKELCTKVSRIFFLCRKETNGLSEKIEDNNNHVETCYERPVSALLEQVVASLLTLSTLLQDDNNLFQISA